MLREQWQNKWRQVVVKNKANIFKMMVFPFLVLLGNILTPLFENPKQQKALKDEFLSILSVCECQMSAVHEHFQGNAIHYVVTVTSNDDLAQKQIFYKIGNELSNKGWLYMNRDGSTQYYCKNSVAFGFYKIPESYQTQISLRKSSLSTAHCN